MSLLDKIPEPVQEIQKKIRKKWDEAVFTNLNVLGGKWFMDVKIDESKFIIEYCADHGVFPFGLTAVPSERKFTGPDEAFCKVSEVVDRIADLLE